MSEVNGRRIFNCSSADDDVSMSSGDGERGKFGNDGTPEFFPNLSIELAPKLKHKFWA